MFSAIFILSYLVLFVKHYNAYFIFLPSVNVTPISRALSKFPIERQSLNA